MYHSKRIYWIPLIMILSFLLDGVMMNQLSASLLEAGYTLVPRTIVITIVVLSFLVDYPQLFWFAVVVGFMYDSYYAGILGVYLALFAMIVRFIGTIRGKLSLNPFTIGIALLVMLAFVEGSVYVLYTSQGFIHLSWQEFLIQRLVPSLILNLVLYYVLYVPLKKFAVWTGEGGSSFSKELRAIRRQ